ncbi:SUF system NifU family Fe-S cluster assembly protein [Candidatus Woesearchaeota archaeon]|nr:SUF system NifU family Fe-S cluster assembly protein [Candidatus Woesearchaeota archaeon]
MNQETHPSLVNPLILKNQIGEDLSETEEIYKENIIDHYKHPHNKGEIEHTTSHRELNTSCGDELTIYLNINNNIIENISFTGHGCAISQASVSMLTDKLKGMSVEQAQQISQEDILNLLGIPISYVRMKCALLSLKTVQGALC